MTLANIESSSSRLAKKGYVAEKDKRSLNLDFAFWWPLDVNAEDHSMVSFKQQCRAPQRSASLSRSGSKLGAIVSLGRKTPVGKRTMQSRSKRSSMREDDKKRCEMGTMHLCPPISISLRSFPLGLPTPNVNLDCVSISILRDRHHLIHHVSRFWRDACIGVLVFMVGPPFI